jgi:hypothetical protein
VRYEQCFYIPEDGILQSQSRENLKSYTDVTCHLAMNHVAETYGQKPTNVAGSQRMAFQLTHISRYELARQPTHFLLETNLNINL